jgi:nucleoside-diphosphate-sugar epimerase
MNILVTGNSGFIASKIVSELTLLGHSVTGIDIINGIDILDLEKLETIIPNYDVIYHIAAQANLNHMKDIPNAKKGMDVNVIGTHNIAYLCAKYNKWIIFASTVCVYGSTNVHPSNEDTTLPIPSEIYAYSKLAGEQIIKGYCTTFGNDYTILRFATIYGPNMREAMGLSIFFRQAMNNKNVTIHGDGLQVRTLTYIDDLIRGIVSVITYPDSKNKTINLSSTNKISTIKMAKDVISITKSSSKIVSIPQRIGQIQYEDFSVENASKYLLWTATTPWKTGLSKTYDWIK